MSKKHTIEFIKNEFMRLKGYTLIEDVYVNSQTKMNYICPHHPDKDLYISYADLSSGHGCKFCGIESRSSKRKTDINIIKEEFKLKNYELLETIFINNHTPMKYKCLNHPNEELYITYTNFKAGWGCSYCSGRKVAKGINDLWTTHPKIAEMLIDTEDGYKYSHGSHEKLEFICQNCKTNTFNRSIYNVIGNNLVYCDICMNKTSYPEKFIFTLLKQLNINFKKEKTFIWSQNRKYDFYLIDYNIIIEVHGEQHYRPTQWYPNIDAIVKNDKLKYDLAINNKINEYIVVDARKSELEFIKQNILESDLSNILDLYNINWDECNKKALISNIYELSKLYNQGITNYKELCKIFNVSSSSIYNYIKKAKEANLINQ